MACGFSLSPERVGNQSTDAGAKKAEFTVAYGVAPHYPVSFGR